MSLQECEVGRRRHLTLIRAAPAISNIEASLGQPAAVGT
jgi:hypothetical protein